MNEYSEEFLRQAEANHCAELADELTDADFEPPTLEELRRRHQSERRALRTWLRRPAPVPASFVARRGHTQRRPRRERVRRRRDCRRARSARVRGARGDPDGDADPDGRLVAAEAHARVGDKSLGELIGHGQPRAAFPNKGGEACR